MKKKTKIIIGVVALVLVRPLSMGLEKLQKRYLLQ